MFDMKTELKRFSKSQLVDVSIKERKQRLGQGVFDAVSISCGVVLPSGLCCSHCQVA